MANWYVDTSATNDGDGTSSAQAGVAGGVGAANDLVAVLKNIHTYITTMAAGDIIYVRTKNGASNCTQVITAAVTMALPSTVDAPVKVIFDNGTVWAGDAGVFRWDCGSTKYKLTTNEYSEFHADGENRRFEIYTTYSSTLNLSLMLAAVLGYYDGVHINAPNAAGYNYITIGQAIFSNLKVTVNLVRTTYSMVVGQTYEWVRLINPVLEILGTPTGTHSLFLKAQGQNFDVTGGKVIGANDTFTALVSVGNQPGIARFIDFDYSGCAGMYRVASGVAPDTYVHALGGASPYNYHEEAYYKTEFKSGENYPYLNSTLPNAANEGWSYKVSPLLTDKGAAATLPPIIKAFNQTAGIKTITLEFLIGTAFSTVPKSDLFAHIFYVDDTTGEQKHLTSYSNTGDLDTSLAAWTNTAYGAKSYNKYKIALTTPTAIKQGTRIVARVYSRIAEVTAGDFWFMDPDLTLSSGA